ncbi:cysteine proteinase [Cucurbitaria berberidis CBS 394.84]|uniref:Cysteine proteinase n=1 Tax=Cucurbitaria berberidis CBS 394.84 TaxID=1168544 RepID=A0A9P4GQ00_9PLEO|nr:cysteine proteinase [Cucurbitaria berberidis CBS 394.84]KAF1849026.1 cysteine proteinase [Cucurbitaria berberidis CBS 394.84]
MADTAIDTAPETLEALQSRHRKEQRDLVSRITQKKKQASKKTRKGVNEECEGLERELKERQEAEVAALNGEGDEDENDSENQWAEQGIAKLSVNGASNESKDSSVNGEEDANAAQADRKKRPNRAKARLARRAAEQSALIADAEREAANAPNPRELERERMALQLQRHKLSLHEIRANGHCLYAAVADQLVTRELGLAPKIPITMVEGGSGGAENGKVEEYKKVRYAAADWIQAHADDFAGFMEDSVPEHVRKIRQTGEWGGHLELLALARTYGVRICVLHSDGQVDKMQPEEETADKELEEIWLGYYKHSHGLGEHYNSLRKTG